MIDRYERIRQALEMGPTPEPWTAKSHTAPRADNGDIGIINGKGGLVAVAYSNRCTRGNASLIAACDPDTIRELLAERDQLAAALGAAREDAERWRALREMDGGEIYALLGDCDGIHPELTDAAIDQAREASAPTIEAAERMGAKGGPVVEAERLAFEAWMREHCWALCATWDGETYRSDSEQGGKVCLHAMITRMMWAAWRDRRAALAAGQEGRP